jgi:hypothetical protein
MGDKKRHGCLTAYLVFMIVANAAVTAVYTVNGDAIRQQVPQMPSWALPVLSVFGVINLVCSVGLWKFKLWGFFGFVVSAIVVAGINVGIGLGIGSAMGGLIGVAILYGVLHIGSDNKGWPQLD